MRKLRLRSPAFSSTTPFRDYNGSPCFSVCRTLRFTRHAHLCRLIISGGECQPHPLFTDGESEAQRTGASRSQEERKCSVAGFQAKKCLSIKAPPSRLPLLRCGGGRGADKPRTCMLRNQGTDHILHVVPTQEVSWRSCVG